MHGLPLYTTESCLTYTLSLHDALPIYREVTGPIVEQNPRRGVALAAARKVVLEDVGGAVIVDIRHRRRMRKGQLLRQDRKSTRLNSSHPSISYAVFCLKKRTPYRCLSS